MHSKPEITMVDREARRTKRAGHNNDQKSAKLHFGYLNRYIDLEYKKRFLE